jgi:hypothetical protein
MKAALRVIAHLHARGLPCALIGGIALGAHGIARATLDTDLLVADPAVLRASFWQGFAALGAPEIRRGDADDPLAGVVRFADDAASVDVLVGKGAWMRAIVARAIMVRLRGRRVPAVDRADLVLLKLFAGGPQDLLDVRLLLAQDPAALRERVEQRLTSVPRSIRTAWRRLLARS